jgi:hypothetical protein
MHPESTRRHPEVMMKFGALFLLGFLLLGTVAADRFLNGGTTAGYTNYLMFGAGLACAFFALGLWAAKRHRTFLGFARWQWAAFPVAPFAAGIAARVYML